MQNTIAQKRKCNRGAKRETRKSFREYTYTKLTMTPYAGFNALPPDTPELENRAPRTHSFSGHSAACRGYISAPDGFFEIFPMNPMSRLMSPVI